jgi:predicted component of type VI protein secretion system
MPVYKIICNLTIHASIIIDMHPEHMRLVTRLRLKRRQVEAERRRYVAKVQFILLI